MPRVAVIYFTKTDVTGQLVDAAVKGLKGKGVDVYLHQIKGEEIVEGRYVNEQVFDEIDACDGIVFATPTYMGGVSAQFKTFADATGGIWAQQKWAGKFACGITCGAGLNGDQASTLQYLITYSSQHAMCWVSVEAMKEFNGKPLNRLGCSLGVVAQSDDGQPHDTDINTAQYLGSRMADLVIRHNR